VKDTDRRIQDASRLGQTLITQRRELTAKLKEVEELQRDAELPSELQSRLAELEREYNEVGRESARAFLPKARVTSESDGMQSPAVISGSGRESPTKMSAPSRRQRNQPTNRIHDIEFATEISTSLLAQVRQLQAALAEKDEALKDVTSNKAQLEAESVNLIQRLRHMDESEQKYKDENWNLETRLQETEASLRESMDKESRLANQLKSMQSDKAAKERELDELKLSQERQRDEQEVARKAEFAETYNLKNEMKSVQVEKSKLENRIQELTAQNTQLARHISNGMAQHTPASDTGFHDVDEGLHSDDGSPDHSAPTSPIKGTPARHGMLESETLKSSLNHAHRMIQNLKNNIHREKTEKFELKRMLQDARDELEQRRESTGIAANVAKKRKGEPEGSKYKRPSMGRLGANRSSTTEIIDEPDWEDQDYEQRTPSKGKSEGVMSRAAVAGAAAASAYARAYGKSDGDTTDAFETANETDTGFETATERGAATESEAFATGAEDLDVDTEGDATETESSSTRKLRPSISTKRLSYMSTASTSGEEDEDDILQTPVHTTQHPKYKLRLGRGGRRSGRVTDMPVTESPPAIQESPSSSTTETPQVTQMQSLGDELDGLDDEESNDGTPSTQRPASAHSGTRAHMDDDELAGVHPATPRSPAQAKTLELASIMNRPVMVDAGVMTEPWQPQSTSPDQESVAGVAGVATAGALAGFGVSRLAQHSNESVGTVQETVPEDAGVDGLKSELPATPSESQEDVAEPTKLKMISIGTDARGVPVSISTGTDTRIIEMNDAGTDARATLTTTVGTDARITSTTTTGTDARAPSETASFGSSARDATQTAGVGSDALPRPQFVSTGSDARVPTSTTSTGSDARAPAILMSTGSDARPPPRTVSTGSDARVPVRTTSTGSDAREPTETVSTGVDARTPAHTISIGTDARGNPVTISIGTATDLEEKSKTLFVQDLPRASMEQSPEVTRGQEPLSPDHKKIIGGGVVSTVEEFSERPPTPAAAPPPLRLEFSHVLAQEIEPELPSPLPPLVPQKSSRRSDAIPSDFVIGDAHLFPDSQHRVRFSEDTPERSPFDDGTSREAAAAATYLRQPLTDLSTNMPPSRPAPSMPMSDEGSQTLVSGGEVDSMLKQRLNFVAIPSFMDASNSPWTDAGTTTNTTSFAVTPTRRPGSSTEARPSMYESPTLRPALRPGSSSSMRRKEPVDAPPLPADHNIKIAAAQQAPDMLRAASPNPMGPPAIPASAYRRPNTPRDRPHHERAARSRDSSRPRALAHKDSQSNLALHQSDRVSHRTSVSSFASELDERFNITRGQIMYPMDLEPATDPRMIQAITQTMIGEYLWKYIRKAGRSEVSSTRHRRFFWVHPYTRTLYWSENDPSTAGKHMMKAKSVAIEAVRVISDDNAYPPGLHRKSIVVITPGREIVFTAPTAQRHETWFNALSYLLLRTEREKSEAEDLMSPDELDEFQPRGFSGSVRRGIGRMAGATPGRSISRQSRRTSMSSYNSRTTRTNSPSRNEATLTQRSSAAKAQNATVSGGLAATSSNQSRTSGSVPGRFSSMANRFRPPSRNGAHSSASSRRPDDPAIYDADVVEQSAEDLRAVIEQQERDADRLENVRACCDGEYMSTASSLLGQNTDIVVVGKHDVGSLSRRHGNPTTANHRHASHSHNHGHGHPSRAHGTSSSRT
jgi:hypothetical protein